MVHTQNGGLVVPAPLPSDGGGWLAVFGLLCGAWFADLVRNFLEFIFAASVSFAESLLSSVLNSQISLHQR
jgi:hypothetical protein